MRFFVFCLGVLSYATAASAAILTFSGQPSTGFPAFVSDTESGFTVVPVAGQFTVGDFFGNPVPDIFTYNHGTSTVQVTEVGGGDFEFTSAALANFASTSSASYTIAGLLGGVQQFSASGIINGNNAFSIYNPGYGGDVIDTLDITLAPQSGNEADLDNIVVTPTPEPSNLLLLGTGFGVLFVAFRRRIFA